jgi:flagellar M-ring protein FliF
MLASLTQLPTRSKIVLGVTALGVVVFLFLMLRLATAPSYSTLMSGLDPADTGKVTEALDSQGIPYELQSNGTALAVQKGDAAKARIALAGEGVSAGSGGAAPGFELFDEQKLGASDFQNKVTYQRALEGEIAKNLNGVEGVTNARVQLVLPEDDLFSDESSPATAAVSLGNAGDALDSGAVKGMAQLVASSVKGLKPANVTIADSSGRLLWPNGADGGGGSGTSKQAAEQRYASSMEANLNAMLASTLGPGKAQVQVQADLNMDKTRRNELRYGRTAVPLTTDTETERLRGTGGATAGGTAGTGSNIPTYSGSSAGGAGGNSNYQRSAKKDANAVDKTVSTTDVAQGAVNRLNVALVLDKSVTGSLAGPAAAAQVKSIQDTVATAAGLDTTRGDTIKATQLAFAKAPEAAKAGPVPAGLLGPLKWVGLGLAALAFCFFMLRHLKKREGSALPQPAWLSQIDQPVPLSALEAGGSHPTRQLDPLPEREVEPGLARLEQLMDREPERVAAQVRAWMDED